MTRTDFSILGGCITAATYLVILFLHLRTCKSDGIFVSGNRLNMFTIPVIAGVVYLPDILFPSEKIVQIWAVALGGCMVAIPLVTVLGLAEQSLSGVVDHKIVQRKIPMLSVMVFLTMTIYSVAEIAGVLIK